MLLVYLLLIYLIGWSLWVILLTTQNHGNLHDATLVGMFWPILFLLVAYFLVGMVSAVLWLILVGDRESRLIFLNLYGWPLFLPLGLVFLPVGVLRLLVLWGLRK